MLEKLITNPLTIKRLNRFRKIKRSMLSLYVFVILLFVSLTAEFWANNKPIIASYNSSIYFPVFQTIHPSEFGQPGFVTDYRKLEFSGEGQWAVWPLVRWNPFESNKKLEEYPAPPSKDNWFGTDDRGRDVLTRLIYGFRYSISFAVSIWLISFVFGTFCGAVMGFRGGKIDLVGQRIVEIFESMPMLILLITLVSIFGASMALLVGFSAIFGWMMISSYVRAEFLKLRKREFVEAARALGQSRFNIIFKHILPNALGPLITFSPFTIAAGISSLAILDYLGFGLPAPTPSWGELLQQAQSNFTIAWWLAVFPSLALFITLATLNLIGEGVRDAFDPRK